MFFNKIFSYFSEKLKSKNKKEALIVRLVLFFLIFGVVFSLIYFPFKALNFSKPYTLILYKHFNGIPFEDYKGFVVSGKLINISEECNGWFEFSVFVALIIATIDVLFWKRIIGVLLLVPLFFLFNLSRIYVIVYGLQNWNLEYVDLLHTFLFKAGLFIFFGVFYYIWLKVSSR